MIDKRNIAEEIGETILGVTDASTDEERDAVADALDTYLNYTDGLPVVLQDALDEHRAEARRQK